MEIKICWPASLQQGVLATVLLLEQLNMNLKKSAVLDYVNGKFESAAVIRGVRNFQHIVHVIIKLRYAESNCNVWWYQSCYSNTASEHRLFNAVLVYTH